MKLMISQPMFFPWVGFFEQVRLCDTYVHYVDVQYSKGSFTNRVQVKSPSGIKWMTVPLSGLKFGQLIEDVRINNQKDWRSAHIALLDQCYREAPYFDEMMTLVESVYQSQHELISTLSQETLKVINDYFGFYEDKKFIDVRDLGVKGSGSNRVFDIATKLNAKKYITGHGASNYLDHHLFEEHGISVEYMKYLKLPYPQMNGAFTPFVSILDLIANRGLDGGDVIKSETTKWRDFINE